MHFIQHQKTFSQQETLSLSSTKGNRYHMRMVIPEPISQKFQNIQTEQIAAAFSLESSNLYFKPCGGQKLVTCRTYSVTSYQMKGNYIVVEYPVCFAYGKCYGQEIWLSTASRNERTPLVRPSKLLFPQRTAESFTISQVYAISRFSLPFPDSCKIIKTGGVSQVCRRKTTKQETHLQRKMFLNLSS